MGIKIQSLICLFIQASQTNTSVVNIKKNLQIVVVLSSNSINEFMRY